MLIPLLSGLAAGSVHVVTGPDHLAAVAPLALRDRRAAARTGAAWGLGHGLGVVLLGGLGMLAREAVDVHALSGWSEFSVGFLLVGLGLWSLRGALGMQIHDHGHAHDPAGAGPAASADHAHPHVHLGAHAHDLQAHQGHSHAAFGVGLFHGAAGMGHLLGVVPALALPPAESAVYLAAYLVAAVGSMALFGLVLGELARRAGRAALRGLVLAASLFTVGVGGWWLLTTFPGA
ncbi:hydantoin utilization protein A [Myxococcota bacterium]|nr:hydantoin utilization protein A [Myxococcota bacterium]